MTQVQDYDWADEVTYAAYGRKWASELLSEDIAFVREIADQEIESRNEKFNIYAENAGN